MSSSFLEHLINRAMGRQPQVHIEPALTGDMIPRAYPQIETVYEAEPIEPKPRRVEQKQITQTKAQSTTPHAAKAIPLAPRNSRAGITKEIIHSNPDHSQTEILGNSSAPQELRQVTGNVESVEKSATHDLKRQKPESNKWVPSKKSSINNADYETEPSSQLASQVEPTAKISGTERSSVSPEIGVHQADGERNVVAKAHLIPAENSPANRSLEAQEEKESVPPLRVIQKEREPSRPDVLPKGKVKFEDSKLPEKKINPQMTRVFQSKPIPFGRRQGAPNPVEPTVTIHIGRIEVHVEKPLEQPETSPRMPVLSLNDYLKKRSEET